MHLPGALWFTKEDDFLSNAPLYGESFVIHRGPAPAAGKHTPGGPCDLVPYTGNKRETGLVLRGQPGSSDLVPLPLEQLSLVTVPADQACGIVPFGWVFDGEDGDDALQPADPESGGQSTPQTTSIVPVSLSRPADMMGLVLGAALAPSQPQPPLPMTDHAGQVYESFSNSPRRTRKIKFTCQRCGATSIRPINPHAWATGTVFAACGGCGIKHKLVDNLKLFHELAGQVYLSNPLAPKRPDTGGVSAGMGAGGAGAPGGEGAALPWELELPDRLRLRLERLLQQEGGLGGE